MKFILIAAFFSITACATEPVELECTAACDEGAAEDPYAECDDSTIHATPESRASCLHDANRAVAVAYGAPASYTLYSIARFGPRRTFLHEDLADYLYDGLFDLNTMTLARRVLAIAANPENHGIALDGVPSECAELGVSDTAGCVEELNVALEEHLGALLEAGFGDAGVAVWREAAQMATELHEHSSMMCESVSLSEAGADQPIPLELCTLSWNSWWHRTMTNWADPEEEDEAF